MHAPRNNKRSWRSRDEVAVDGLVVSGLTELALGALTGWLMAVAVSQPQDLGKLGIRSGARLRQWHLDLIMLGGLTAAAPSFVPDPPARSPSRWRSAPGSTPTRSGCWPSARAQRPPCL
jgi:hypothetical protein